MTDGCWEKPPTPTRPPPLHMERVGVGWEGAGRLPFKEAGGAEKGPVTRSSVNGALGIWIFSQNL